MFGTDPSQDRRRVRLPRLPPVACVLLAITAGAAPWLAMVVSIVWPGVLP
jgi:hypothetical protein